MANSLLDFVMSLVRDPDAAARYAADPAAAIADAQLTDVTSVDVDNLIPVVTESMPMVAPSTGLDAFGAEPAGNVWASGAATAAFDAFADPAPATGVIDTGMPVIDTTPVDVPAVDALAPPDTFVDTVSPQLTDPVFDDAVTAAADHTDVWGAAGDDPQPADPTPGFDLFD
ncbi:Rv0340 family IniB-related protein [Mycolicibacterium litorale]|uniref:Rv0340 family IniB-related protein n=1 Tax=Mycolicibacterium litorale TaxID=758802 RepID=UPI003CEA5B54